MDYSIVVDYHHIASRLVGQVDYLVWGTGPE